MPNLNHIINATKAEKLAKARKERVKIGVETKQLSLRVAEERFDVARSTIHGNVLNKYYNIGAERPTI